MKKITILFLLIAITASAGQWSGHNGTIVLSFEQNKLERVADIPTTEGMGILVDVYAYLTDIEDIKFMGEKVITAGGYELELLIESSEGQIISQNLPEEVQINLGKELGSVIVGLYPDISLMGFGAELAHWQILLPENSENVRFSLNKDSLISPSRVEACNEADPIAIWVGGQAANQHGFLFGAACAPAYLNWDGKPELEIIRGKTDASEIGLFD